MCGIVGFVGEHDALDVLMTGLSGLEYRGYDSAGVAVGSEDGLSVVKRQGELDNLRKALAGRTLTGHVGIGHTRWSTHGPPSDANAHPHTDCEGRVAVVHNGIIENDADLRAALEREGHAFTSETDTEVVAHLVERSLAAGASPATAFDEAVDELDGSYALGVVVAGTDAVFAAREGSPLVLGVGDRGTYLGSDVTAFIEYTDRVVYVEDGQRVRLDRSGYTVTDADGTAVEPAAETVSFTPEDAGKSGYEHYMLKEIHEQPRAIRECLQGRLNELYGTVDVVDDLDLAAFDAVHFVACGTSYHAALYGAHLLGSHDVPAYAFLASEYVTSPAPAPPNTLVVGVTQSGETADTIQALRAAKRQGLTTAALTNVVGSTAVRETDHVVYSRSGPEIGVAATKTFTGQVTTLAMFALAVAAARGDSAEDVPRAAARTLRAFPDRIQDVLDDSRAAAVAEEYADADAYFFIGRECNYPVALEGALKMKEITYEHAEGFAAGELKHGPLALVDEDTPVFAVVSGSDEVVSKTLGNVKEVQARGAPVIAICHPDVVADVDVADVLEIPDDDPLTAPLLANVQLQLLAYHTARLLGRSIDRPRNLAKSVTVE